MRAEATEVTGRQASGVLRRKPGPEHFFLAAGLVFGLLFLVLTPPFQVPDELAHASRAWQISTGRLLHGSPRGEIPRALHQAHDDFEILKGARQKRNQETNDARVTPEELLDLLGPKARRLDGESVVTISNAFIYFPAAYVPSAAGFLAARLAGLPPVWWIYAGRLCNLAVWLAILFYAIRVAPVFKWELAFLALLPMSLFQGMSVSADSMIFAWAFLLTALVAESLFGEAPPGGRRMALMLLVVFLLAGGKQIFALPFFLTLFGVDRHETRAEFFRFLLFGVLVIVLACLWPALNSLPRAPRGHDPRAALDQLLATPLTPLKALARTLLRHGRGLVDQYIGALGWLDVRLPAWLYGAYAMALVGMGLFLCRVKSRVRPMLRLGALSIFALNVSLTILTLFVIWPSREPLVAAGVQGRYFIPIVPVLLFACAKRGVPGISPSGGGRAAGSRFEIAAAALLALVTLVGLSFSVQALAVRFYK